MPDDQQVPREEGAAAAGDRSGDDGLDQTREHDPFADREPGSASAAGPDETAPLPPADGAADDPDSTERMAAPDSTERMPAPDSTAPMPAAADRTVAQGPLSDTVDQQAAPVWSARAEVPPAGAQAGYPGGDTAYAPRPATEWEQVEPEDTGKWWLPIVLGLIGLLLLGVLIYGLWLIFAANDESSPGPAVTPSVTRAQPTTQAPRTTAPPPSPTAAAPVDVVVPPVAGLPVADARDLLDARGLTYRLESRTTENQPAGTVIETDPPAGTRVPTRSEITIVVAAAPRPPEPPPPPPPASTPPASPNG